jgi:lactate dehydrogenase-like 2-hydroxyacid dehydrogenase
MTDAESTHVLLAARLMPSVIDNLNASVRMLDGREPAERARLVRDHAATIRAIATNAHDGASRALIESLPNLEIIACFSAGLDHVDTAAAAERGIVVTATSHILADDVADVAIAKCLLLLRRFAQADRFVRDGAWGRGESFPLGRSLRGKRMGLIGMGAIATAIARRAEAMGMTVAYTARTEKPALPQRFFPDPTTLATHSDILTVCCPATEATRGLVNADVLAALGPDGWLINIARGSVVDEPALIAALRSGGIAGAGLDVFDNEPNPTPALLAMDNVSLSPHIGSGAHETRAAMGQAMIDSLRGHFAGR